MNKKALIISLGSSLVLAIGGAGAYWWYMNQPEQRLEQEQKLIVANPVETEQQGTITESVEKQSQEVAPATVPILVKAGGVIQLSNDEEMTIATERRKYAAPTAGEQVMLQNLYGGVKIELPSSLYNDLEPVLKELRDKLSPSDYAQLLRMVQYLWEVARHEEYAEITSSAQMRAFLEKVAKAPEDPTLFPRARVVVDKKVGTVFSPSVRHANGQIHYADERVLVSLNHQKRFTARDQGVDLGRGELPTLNQFWDARTEKLLLRTVHHEEYFVPLRIDLDTYALCSGFYDNRNNKTEMLRNAQIQINVRKGMLLPTSFEGKRIVQDENEVERIEDGVSLSQSELDMEEASKASNIGVRIQLQPCDEEHGITPLHEEQIQAVWGSGSELRYTTCWGESFFLNLRSLSINKVSREEMEAFTLPQAEETELKEEEEEFYGITNLRIINKLRLYTSSGIGEDYSSNEHTLKESLKWPLRLRAKTYTLHSQGVEVELSDWRVGSGSKEIIAFTAFAQNDFDAFHSEFAIGTSVYTGVWFQGKAWMFTVPQGAKRVKSWFNWSDFPLDTRAFHGVIKGKGRMVPLEEVKKQTKRSPDLLSWDDCALLVTEPEATEEYAYLLIGGTKNVHRLKVNFVKETVEYLTSWFVNGTILKTVWLEDFRILLLPASDNHFNMVKMKPDGTSEELGQLYITEADGYAIVLKDGRYAGTPGCESFLNYSHGRQTINMKTLAPWRNRPAEVLEVLGGNEEDIAALRETTRRWLQRQGYDADNMPPEPKLGEFPKAKVELPELFTNEDLLTVPVKLSATAKDLSRLEVLRDGIRIPQPQLKESDAAGTRNVSVQVPLATGQNWIEVTPVDVAGVAGETTRFRVIRKGATAPKFFVVALGVSDYEDDTLDLQYASKDAQDMAKAWSDCSGMETRTLVLTNNEVKDSSVLEQIKNFLSAATISDKVVFYLAGHGMLDANMDYYYAPASFDTERVAETGISADAIMDCLESSAAQTRVLLMDTCHAGELGEAGEDKIAMSMGKLPPGVRAIQHRGMKVRKSALSYRSKKRYIEEMFSAGSTQRGINMLSASAGAEYALETTEMRNGVFTASIIEALREPAWRDSNRDGILWVEELFHAVQDAVKTRTGGLQTPSISMMENRGYNDIAYHPGYHLQKGDYAQAVAMINSGVKLTNDENVRKERYESAGYYWDGEERKYRSWLGKAMQRDERLFEALLANGVDVNSLWSLVFTERDYYTEETKELINLLLQHGADVNTRDDDGKTLLMYCIDSEVAKLLLEHGANVNARDNVGKTPLMYCNGSEVVELLLKHGADVNARDINGRSVKDWVPDNVKKIIEKSTNGEDETAGMNAAQIRKLATDYALSRNGKDKNKQKAMLLYIQAADKGDIKAQRWMGYCYRDGRGVPKDKERARYYFSKAADQGDSQSAILYKTVGVEVEQFIILGTIDMNAAQIRELGVDYAEARNGKSMDVQKAVQLYIQAAGMGDSTAQRWMGWRYRQGKGVHKDELKALYYFSLAAVQGDTQAEDALNSTPVQPKKAAPQKAQPKKAAVKTNKLILPQKKATKAAPKKTARNKAAAVSAATLSNQRDTLIERMKVLEDLQKQPKKESPSKVEMNKRKPFEGFNW